jgi:hypothetical protein
MKQDKENQVCFFNFTEYGAIVGKMSSSQFVMETRPACPTPPTKEKNRGASDSNVMSAAPEPNTQVS